MVHVLSAVDGNGVQAGRSGDAERVLVRKVEQADEADVDREVIDQAFAGAHHGLLYHILRGKAQGLQPSLCQHGIKEH